MAYCSDSFYDKVSPNYNSFIKELTKISKQYGVAIHGHFELTDDISQFKNLRYTNDISSSDIYPYNY
jgi:hypothetical protein